MFDKSSVTPDEMYGMLAEAFYMVRYPKSNRKWETLSDWLDYLLEEVRQSVDDDD